MTIELMKRWKQNVLWLALLAMLLATSGCFSLRNPFGRRTKGPKGLVVVAQTNTEAIQLAAVDVANILVGIGFTREQAFAIGGDLQQALMLKGRADIRQDGETIVLMRVLKERIQIVSSVTGYHEYDVKMHQFILGGPGLQSSTMSMPQDPMMQMMPQQQQASPQIQQQPGMMQTYPNTYPSFPTTPGQQYIY